MRIVHWHVLHAAPQSEPQICKYLALHAIEGYAPQFPPPRRTKPGSVRDRKHRWVFPGYVFFRVARGFTGWDVIRWAPGVRQMLESDGAPAVIEDVVMDHLRRRLADRALNPAHGRFIRGQRIVIQDGPLRMLDAIFDRELGGPARVQILVHLLGRQLPVEIDPATLRAAS